MSSRLLHVRAYGSPGEIGRLHGERARDLIEANIRLYFHRFQHEWGVPREEALRRARMYAEVIEEVSGDYTEAMIGVSDGSGIPFHEIVAINVRYEIVYSEYSRMGKEVGMPSGCTAIALLPTKTKGGHLLMAQNWDWIPGVRGMILQYRLPRGPEVLAFTEAGIVGGKIGLNSEGLGLLINGLVSDQDRWERLGVPFHVRCWQVLCSDSLEEASLLLKNSPASCSANFMLGQVGGRKARILDLETCPLGTQDIQPKGGLLTHANHFRRREALGIWEPLMEERTSTFERQARVDTLLEEEMRRVEGVGEEELRRLLRDHDGQPKSLCRHPDTNLPEAQRYQTVVSVVMDLNDRRLMVADGPPCITEYEGFSLNSRRDTDPGT